VASGVSLQHLARTNANSSKIFDSNVPFYTRTFIRRPEIKSFPSIDPWVDPSEVDKVVAVVKEIFKHNNESFSTLLRLSVNAVHPKSKVVTTIPHIDHPHTPHSNFIIYLTDAGGSTFVDDEKFDPKEDDVILFKGEHYHNTPVEKRRVILVATMVE